MARKPRQYGKSPTLKLSITPERWEKAIASHSGACLISDAIKDQYPHLTNPETDMATIRVTDKAAGVRYTYLTPDSAQHLLLSYDQGWPQSTEEVTIRAAVQILPIRGSSTKVKAKVKANRDAVVAKVERGEELTRIEKGILTRAQTPTPDRPLTHGPAEVVDVPGQRSVVVGGKARVKGPAHPNLLRGRNRHFGKKMSDPGVAFKEAVAAAVAEERKKDAT